MRRAISSSGLVRPSRASAREAQLTSSGPKAPLPTLSIVPAPSIRVPAQVTFAVRSVAICRLLVSSRTLSWMSIPTPCVAQERRERAARVGRLGGRRERRPPPGPGTCARTSSAECDDQVPSALDLVHRDRAAHVEPLRAACRRRSARPRATS